MTEESLISLGSQGSTFAVVFFGTLFVVLGVAVGLAMHRSGRSRVTSWIVGFFLFLGPFGLVNATSFNGFRTIQLLDDRARLSYAIPGLHDDVPWASISKVEARPAHKLLWRVHVHTDDGDRYESVTLSQDSAREAVARLREHLEWSRADD